MIGENLGKRTLDKEENITTRDFDEETMLVDPLFKQKTKQFDDLSQSNLLTATLAVDSNLLLTLDSQLACDGMRKDRETKEKRKKQV